MSLLAEISLLTNGISDELYRARDISTRLSDVEKKQLSTVMEREKRIDAGLSNKMATFPSITSGIAKTTGPSNT